MFTVRSIIALFDSWNRAIQIRLLEKHAMDGRLVVLKRVVEALDEDCNIASFDDRKRLQKAIYLAQIAGIDLGYRYGWYIKGPYSTDLTRD